MNKKEMKHMVEDLKKEKSNLEDILKTEEQKKVGLTQIEQNSSVRKSASFARNIAEEEINEETEIKFELEKERQAQLLQRQKLLNQKLMLAKGKQNSLAKKLYRYKQVLIREGYSHMVESTRISKISVDGGGQVIHFEQFYDQMDRETDEPHFSDKFVKKNEKPRQEEVGRKKAPGQEKKKRGMRNSYLNKYSSKKLLGETGNQKKLKKTSTLRKTTKSEKNLRSNAQKQGKKKANQSQYDYGSKYSKKRRKSTAAREEHKLTKNKVKKTHRTNPSKSTSNRNKKSVKKATLPQKKQTNEIDWHQPRISSKFQKMEQLQSRKVMKREESQLSISKSRSPKYPRE